MKGKQLMDNPVPTTYGTPNEKVYEDLICNKCGDSLKTIMSTYGDYNFSGLEEVKAMGTYCSEPLLDGEIYIFSLCGQCTKDLMDSFKHPPEVRDYLHGYEEVPYDI